MALKKEFLIGTSLCRVTFCISKKACLNTHNINITGDFNSWSSTETPLTKQKDGSFSVTLDLPINKEFQYRYLYDGERWENDWDADKYKPALYSNIDNSVVITSLP